MHSFPIETYWIRIRRSALHATPYSSSWCWNCKLRVFGVLSYRVSRETDGISGTSDYTRSGQLVDCGLDVEVILQQKGNKNEEKCFVTGWFSKHEPAWLLAQIHWCELLRWRKLARAISSEVKEDLTKCHRVSSYLPCLLFVSHSKAVPQSSWWKAKLVSWSATLKQSNHFEFKCIIIS